MDPRDLPELAKSTSAILFVIDATIIPESAYVTSLEILSNSPGPGEFGPTITNNAFAPRSRASIALYRNPA